MSGYKRRAGIYVRVSTEEQAEKGYSLEGQLASCRQKALELGYVPEECAVFTDDVSGTRTDRPGLNALREWCRSPGRPEAVVVYDPDRLARKLSLQLMLTDEWLKRGIRLEFVNFEWSNTAEGRMFYQLRGMFAEFEREKIRERTIRGKLTKLQTTGKLSVDPRLFGFRFDTERDVLVVEPGQAQVVMRIFRMAAGGLSGEEIARTLAREGVPAPRGSRWFGSTVTRILHNRSYLGEYKAYKTDYHQGYKRKRPESEQYSLPIEPLVEEELFQEAQRTLLRSRTRTGRPAKREVLLAGLAKCPCGRSMVAGGASSGRPYSYYICTSKLKSSYDAGNGGAKAPDCSNGYWNTSVTDGLVWREIVRFLLVNRSSWAGYLQEESWAAPGPDPLRAEQKAAEAAGKLRKLLELYLSDGISRELYDERRQLLEQEEARWRQQAEEEAAVAYRSIESLEHLQGGLYGSGEEAAGILAELPFEVKLDIVRLLLEHVVLDGGETAAEGRTDTGARKVGLIFRLSEKPSDGQSHGGS
ncbi:recombinase family protein [Gorillibacterium sp. sgz5001074]|uniref:recombinase family protein n=1 Tax=Gorillibacterium sp. sgz5001074 TaxID=3446695 RepID=UPI003F6728F1